MKRFSSALIGAGLAAMVAAAGHAQTFTKTAVVNTPALVSGGSTIQIFSGASTGDASGPGTDILVANLRTVSATVPPPADTFTNAPYSIDVTITDADSGLSHLINVAGLLSGPVSLTQVTLTNVFTSALTDTFTLGSNQYTYELKSFTPPEVPTSPLNGAINAHITATHVNVPEPGTFALLGTGVLPLLGIVRRRRS